MGLDRDFLSMLTADVSLERNLGEDLFGNENYSAPETIPAYVANADTAFGSQDGQGQQDTPTVASVSLTTDAEGIKVKDRFTIPSGDVYYVSSATTGHDEFGQPLYQTVQGQTERRG